MAFRRKEYTGRVKREGDGLEETAMMACLFLSEERRAWNTRLMRGAEEGVSLRYGGTVERIEWILA